MSRVHSVASFFVSRVDTEVDRRLEASGTDKLAVPAGQGRRGPGEAGLQALPGPLRRSSLGGAWQAKGAHVQRPLWASTSTKNPAYPDLLYVDSLIGPDTVNTMPDATVEAFKDHGTVARTVDQGVDQARADLDALHEAGIDMSDVSRRLEEEGVASFSKSYDELLQALEDKANEHKASS